MKYKGEKEMKKSKLILLIVAALLVVALVCVFIFCSDGWFKQKWKKVLDGSLYESETIATKKLEVSALAGATYKTSTCDLAYFTSSSADGYTTHIVYNITRNEVIFTKTDGKTVDYEVSLSSMNDCAYFVVTVNTCNEKNGNADWSDSDYETVLYDSLGKDKASVDKHITATQNYPFLVFDDTYYDVSKDNGIKKVFEKNPLGKTPDVDLVCGNYYIGSEDEMIIVYDKSMKIVSSYILPSYAESTGAGVLSEEKLFFQYLVEVDPESTKYDILDDGDKYDLHTVIFNVKNGKVKEINCKYVVKIVINLENEEYAEYREELGMNEKVGALAVVYPIVNQRVDESIEYISTISESGKIKLFEKLENFDVTEIALVNTNRWAVSTTSGVTYLVNEKFEIIGDVSNVSFYNAGDKYIAVGGKLYDYNLKEVFDYEDEDLTLQKMFATSVMFADDDGEYYLYYNGKLNQITETKEITNSYGYTNKEQVKRFDRYYGSLGYGVYDYSDKNDVRYYIYNSEGKILANLSVNQTSFYISVKYSYDSQMLISIETYDNTSRKYVTDYYVIK